MPHALADIGARAAALLRSSKVATNSNHPAIKHAAPAAGLPHTEGARLGRLDGLRAVAVVLVFGAHTLFGWHGWEGVHLFFVLSGFLITRILRRTREDTAYWRPFYIKRATRILPPLVICFALIVFLSRPPWQVLPGYLFFAANLMDYTGHGFGKGLNVLWSHSVEEHFYIVWPLAVRFCTRRQLLTLSAAICVLSPLLRLAFTPQFAAFQAIYMLTPFQLDGLAAGSLLAVLSESQRASDAVARFSRPAFLLSTALYCGLTFGWHGFYLGSNSRLFNSLGYSLVVIVAFSAISSVYLHPNSLASRWLASRPMVFLGTISYGFYLFHEPMLTASSALLSRLYGRPRGLIMVPAAFLAAVMLSWLSFHFYEKRLILWGRRVAHREGAPRSPALPSV